MRARVSREAPTFAEFARSSKPAAPRWEQPAAPRWEQHAPAAADAPMLADRFAGLLPDADGRCLRVVDAFVVKYDAAGGQKELKPHRDGSVFSFNIALNERCEYEGGGTWFAGIDRAFAIERGHVLAHPSGMLHGGHPITEGTRYILVAFVAVAGADSRNEKVAAEGGHGVARERVRARRGLSSDASAGAHGEAAADGDGAACPPRGRRGLHARSATAAQP